MDRSERKRIQHRGEDKARELGQSCPTQRGNNSGRLEKTSTRNFSSYQGALAPEHSSGISHSADVASGTSSLVYCAEGISHSTALAPEYNDRTYCITDVTSDTSSPVKGWASHHAAPAPEHSSSSFNTDATSGTGNPVYPTHREFHRDHQRYMSAERSASDGESHSLPSHHKKHSCPNLDPASSYHEQEMLADKREQSKSCYPAAALFRECQMKIAVSEHVWNYMKEYHKKEMMFIWNGIDICKGQQDEVILTVRFPSYDDFLKKFEYTFRQLYERLTYELTVTRFNMTTAEDFEAISQRLRRMCRCMPYWSKSENYMHVICHKVDRALIRDSVNEYTMICHSGLPAKQVSASHFEPSGYIHNNGVRIYLHMNDIISLAVDAITSPSNCMLDNIGGLASNIFMAAGPEVEAECKQIIERLGRCLFIGEVVQTKGGRLAAKYVLHVVGPQCPQVLMPYTERQCYYDLVAVFWNLLIHADKCGFKTIAIPPVSSGVFGVPYQLVARAAHGITGVIPEIKNVSEVHFVDISEEFLSELQLLFMEDVKACHLSEIPQDEVTSRITSGIRRIPSSAQMSLGAEKMSSLCEGRTKLVTETHCADATSRSRLGFQTKKFLVCGSVSVILQRGDITAMDVDVIVNPTNSTLVHSRGLGYVIKQKAGPKYAEGCQKILQHHQFLYSSDVLTVPAGDLPCKRVYLAVSPRWSYTLQRQCLSDLATTFKKVFAEARKSNISSLACPAIGGGASGIPFYHIANILYEALLSELKRSHLQEVYIVDINDDALQEIYELFSSKTTKSQFEEITQEDQSLAEAVVRNGRAEDKETGSERGRQHSEGRNLKQKKEKITSKENRHVLSNKKGLDSEEDGNRLRDGKELNSEKDADRKEELEITEGCSGVSSNEEKNLGEEDRNKQEKATSEQHDQSEDNVHNSTDIKGNREKDDKHVASTNSTGDRREEVNPRTSTQNCVICLCEMIEPKTLSCNHIFCKKCIDLVFRKYKSQCPCCGRRYGQSKGDQPEGSMSVSYSKSSLPGYDSCGTIKITYNIPDGTQGPNHPNPGQRYTGTQRTAFLPDNEEGQQILALLRKAFDAKLVFTVGISVTTGAENVVVWNDIHHKTSTHGGPTRYGYPDPTYLSRVRQELADKGIQ